MTAWLEGLIVVAVAVGLGSGDPSWIEVDRVLSVIAALAEPQLAFERGFEQSNDHLARAHDSNALKIKEINKKFK